MLGAIFELFASNGAGYRSYFSSWAKLTLGKGSICSSSALSFWEVGTGGALGSTFAGGLAGGAFALASLPAGAKDATIGYWKEAKASSLSGMRAMSIKTSVAMLIF